MRTTTKLLLASITAAITLSARPALADSPTLSMKAVDEVLEHHDRAVQACGKSIGSHSETVAVVVALTVDAFGHVTSVAPETGNARLAKCITQVVRKMEFPVAQMDSTLALPFLFNPRR